MKKYLYLLTLVLGGSCAVVFFSSYNKVEKRTAGASLSLTNPKADNSITQEIRSVDLNKKFDFAGEPLPMENFDVKERLDREFLINTYLHSATMLNLKRTSRYFPVIEKILEEEGVPSDFKYLAIAESNLSNAVSSAGAKGIWQFMKPVAEEYGLEVSDEVDERYNLEKSTYAACKLLKDYKRRFGSWTSAAAAYNFGSTRFARYMAEQLAETYYDLHINEETSRYIFRLVALKEIVAAPHAFGFYLSNDDYYPELNNYSVVLVNEPISNWAAFAKNYGVSYRMFKVYNPWLIDTKLSNPSKKSYSVKIPK